MFNWEIQLNLSFCLSCCSPKQDFGMNQCGLKTPAVLRHRPGHRSSATGPHHQRLGRILRTFWGCQAGSGRPFRQVGSKQNFWEFSVEDSESAFWQTLSRQTFSRPTVLFSCACVPCLSWYNDPESHQFAINSVHFIQVIQPETLCTATDNELVLQANRLVYINKEDTTSAFPR